MTSSTRIKPHHLARQAIIYVRQSTAQQTIQNRESLSMQYALRERAIQLGWPASRVVVIDSDLGMTGSSSEGRPGFQNLVSRVSLDQAGAVFAFDVTRLARNCSDWYQLLDLCGLRQCLIGDGDSVYDPSEIDGRLLLGLKGQISEMELHTIRARLTAGMLNKARRGELIIDLPIGYIKTDEGTAQKHPDREVQSRIEMVFRKFLQLKSLGKVVRYFNEHKLLMPRRIRGGAGVRWCEPTVSSVSSMVRNPTYAGAYAYGKTRFVPQKSASHKRYKQRIEQDQWKVLIQDRHQAYVTWEQFMTIQERLESNLVKYNSLNSSGIPRQGAALLQGIVYCGKCGHQMTVQYRQGGQYRCNYLYQQRCLPVCLSTRSPPVDEIVEAEVLGAVSHAEIGLLERSLQELHEQRSSLQKARLQKLERLRYEVARAENQYQLCDPENRLVASELEHRWEEALAALSLAEQESLASLEPAQPSVAPKLLKQWQAAGSDINSLWHDGRMDNVHKKRIVRALINKVVLKHPQAGKIEIRIVWTSGMHTTRSIDLKVGSLSALANGDQLREKIIEHARSGRADEWIAYTLSREGFRGCDRSFVGLGIVSRIRCEAGINRDPQRRFLSGDNHRFSLNQIAKRLGVKIDWLFEQIILKKVTLEPDPIEGRFIIEAGSEAMAKLEELQNAETETCAQRGAS
jgi:DNA invertase Pin-like site-specific DNA recombinase